MNTRERVLKEALNCVNGEREKQYGNPEDNFSRIADLWSVYLTSLFEDEKIVVDIDPIDVAKMMILFKIARSNGDKDKLDNYIDILGYGACAAEIFENSEVRDKVLKKKEELGVQLADECKECDYAEKCIGTGVCLKEKEKELIADCDAKKDKPDEKCNRNDCGQFDACMTAYQHYIYNKTKEASEAIDECMCDRKTDYGSYLQSFNNISACIIRKSSKANVNPCDVVDNLTRNGHAPTEMAALLQSGELGFEDVAFYVKKAINEVKKEGKSKEDSRIYVNPKVTDSDKAAYRNEFNKEAEQMIQNLKADKKIIRAVEVPEGFDISYIYMTDEGQIIVRFNPIKEDKK